MVKAVYVPINKCVMLKCVFRFTSSNAIENIAQS